MSSQYKVCDKCGVRHSTLVRHKCFKPEEQKEKPDTDPQGEGEGEGEGSEGEAKPSEGEGQGAAGQGGGEEGEGEGEGEAPAPKPPEEGQRTEVIICTVLKFAALTAQCAKNGTVEVLLAEDGLLIYGHNGGLTATAVIPWGDFETRSTLDGEYYVKEVVDEVDGQLIEGEAVPDNSEKLVLPIVAGQLVRFVTSDGAEMTGVTERHASKKLVRVESCVFRAGTGQCDCADDCDFHIIANVNVKQAA